MPRFWLYSGFTCLGGLVVGCAVRHLEGTWAGSLPSVSAQGECRFRLLLAGKFDFKCPGPLLKEGAGRYRLEGDELLMDFDIIREQGHVMTSAPAPMRARLKGPGNRMTLILIPGGQEMVWRRVMR